jgi:hypothetical protein
MPNRTGNEPSDRPIARYGGLAREIATFEAFQRLTASAVRSGRPRGQHSLFPAKGSLASERGRRRTMSLLTLADESLLRFYESIRKEVEADRHSVRRGYNHCFANSDGIKRYAASLRQEIERRRLSVSPILWL